MTLLEEINQQLTKLPPKQRADTVEAAIKATGHLLWIPNPGPQTAAYLCDADEIFFGGEAGGGKSDLGIGLALTEHKKSLILRRFNNDALALAERAKEILGDRSYEFAKQPSVVLRVDGRTVDFSGCKEESDKQRFKGDPHDLIVFDEGSDFLFSQYKFITAWNRSVDPNQRCRIVVTSNPPTAAEGLWVIQHWAAWLDPDHKNPAKPGEIRWYIRLEDDTEEEVDGRGPHLRDGRELIARSRTFIRSKLSDNPDLADTNYASVLDGLPVELRAAYRDGNFRASLRDEPMQVCPSAWVEAAMARWTPSGGEGMAMSAMAHDPAGGGVDPAGLVVRYGPWFSKFEIEADVHKKSSGSLMAAWCIAFRRDDAPIIIDIGGGYGGTVIMRLDEDNGIPAHKFSGAEATAARSRDGKLRFANKRSAALWAVREELDPDQPGGAVLALPPDPELRADLTAARWKMTAKGVQVEPKEDIKARIGRSPTKGDLVMMCLSEGNRAAERSRMVRRTGGGPDSEQGGRGRRAFPKTVLHKPR